MFDDETTTTRERADAEDLFEPRTADLPMLVTPTAGSPEFQALVSLASGRTRDERALAAQAKRIGERLGARAIYSFPAGGGRIEGASIHLAEALAQAWGCLLYGTRIESVDGDRVTIVGMCVDAITGTVAVRPAVFSLPPAPKKFAEKADQAARWESMQVQSAISKATRGVILHSIPRWFTDIAYEAADAVRRHGLGLKEGQTLADAVAEAVAYFAKAGITEAEMEAFVNAARPLWTISDLYTLKEAVKSMKAGTLSREAFRVKEAPAPAKGGLAERLSEKPKEATAQAAARADTQPEREYAPTAPTDDEGV